MACLLKRGLCPSRAPEWPPPTCPPADDPAPHFPAHPDVSRPGSSCCPSPQHWPLIFFPFCAHSLSTPQALAAVPSLQEGGQVLHKARNLITIKTRIQAPFPHLSLLTESRPAPLPPVQPMVMEHCSRQGSASDAKIPGPRLVGSRGYTGSQASPLGLLAAEQKRVLYSGDH